MRHVAPWTMIACAAGCAAANPYAEVLDQGLDRYLGTIQAADTVTDAGGDVAHSFGLDQGPVCLLGGDFYVTTRDQPSEDLVIFLQGGGVCWSGLCLAAPLSVPGIPTLDVFDASLPDNPVAGWDIVYVPYCDGSLFAGDVEIDTDDDGTVDRYQRGLLNLSAALDVAKATFPSPKRILFAGSSGGGFGTIVGTPLVRTLWPDAEVLVMNDSGVGVAKDGDATYVRSLVQEFGAEDIVPASCPDCLAGGNLTPVVDWQLAADPDLQVAMYSSTRDFVITQMFLQVDPTAWGEAMLRETSALQTAYPERFARFVDRGNGHTTLVGSIEGVLGSAGETFDAFEDLINLGGLETTQVDGVKAGTWLGGLITGQDWRSIVQEESR